MAPLGAITVVAPRPLRHLASICDVGVNITQGEAFSRSLPISIV